MLSLSIEVFRFEYSYCTPAGELLAMFKACMPVIRCDIQSARFLMPYLLQCVISTGKPHSCKGDSICSASTTETTTHLLCMQLPYINDSFHMTVIGLVYMFAMLCSVYIQAHLLEGTYPHFNSTM